MFDLKNIVSYSKTSLDYDEDNPIHELLVACEAIKNQSESEASGMFIC